MQRLLAELLALRKRMLDVEAGVLRAYPRIHGEHVRSACNLAHYTALRSRENRALQNRLARLGFSSLGRAEGSVLANVDAVLRLVATAERRSVPHLPASRGRIPLLRGREILDRRATALLGRPRAGRSQRVLVTLPGEAAHVEDLVKGLVAAGMDCARINCAHDDADAWSRMIGSVRRAARAARRHIPIVMDLAGPKLRTGPLTPGPDVVHWRPRRDELGRPVDPARVWLVPLDAPAPPPGAAQAVVPVSPDWLSRRRSGDTVTFVDARGSVRSLRIVGASGRGRWAIGTQSAYVVVGTRIEAVRSAGHGARDVGTVGRLPSTERPLLLERGDEVIVTRSLDPGIPAQRDASGAALAPARIGCTLPQAFAAARPGHAAWFDDGKLGGVITAASPDEIRVRIEHASPGGDRLRADKGINLPDTPIDLPALTEKDVRDLRFVVAHADAVAQSFVRCRSDVEDLAERLAALGRPDFGVILKIETRQAFDRLPEILFASMRSPLTGVMIARGDLAVECGWERLAEVQEEILWFCEAAHAPVVWATQVLDGMARTGRPSRAEVTDAAMSVRAECVMLNKGPHICEAVATLDHILRRMEGHMLKKRTLLRRLHVAERFAKGISPLQGSRTGRRTKPRPAAAPPCATGPELLNEDRIPRPQIGHAIRRIVAHAPSGEPALPLVVPARPGRAAAPRLRAERGHRTDGPPRPAARAVCVTARDGERRRIP